MTDRRFAISGMTCNGCRTKVETALRVLDPNASVTLDPAMAVLAASEAVTLESVQKALGDGHYRASLPETVSHQPLQQEKSWFVTYYPLLLIAGYIGTVSLAGQGAASLSVWMNHFMAGFFLVFSFFKFLDLKGFASSYASYDLLAKNWPGYGLVYPFIELGLGLACLFQTMPLVTNLAIIAIMGFSSLGVIQALSNGQKIRCACLGTVLNLPMSSITLVEDLAMVLMALGMIILPVGH